MKKTIIFSTVLILNFIVNTSFSSAYQRADKNMDVYEKEQKNIVEKIKDPIEKGTQDISKKIQGIQYLGDKIKNNEQSQDSFIKYISTPINYIIGFLGMITIILIIKDGIIMIGSAGDEEKKKEAFKNIKNYIITIVFIGVARLIIMLLFNMINTIG